MAPGAKVRARVQNLSDGVVGDRSEMSEVRLSSAVSPFSRDRRRRARGFLARRDEVFSGVNSEDINKKVHTSTCDSNLNDRTVCGGNVCVYTRRAVIGSRSLRRLRQQLAVMNRKHTRRMEHVVRYTKVACARSYSAPKKHPAFKSSPAKPRPY